MLLTVQQFFESDIIVPIISLLCKIYFYIIIIIIDFLRSLLRKTPNWCMRSVVYATRNPLLNDLIIKIYGYIHNLLPLNLNL